MDNLESLIGQEIYFEKSDDNINLYSSIGKDNLTSGEIAQYHINTSSFNDDSGNKIFFFSVICEVISDGELLFIPLDEIYKL